MSFFCSKCRDAGKVQTSRHVENGVGWCDDCWIARSEGASVSGGASLAEQSRAKVKTEVAPAKCPQCGKEILRLKTNGDPFKYCSPECDKAAMAQRAVEAKPTTTPEPPKAPPEPEKLCGCGRPVFHRGICSWRRAKPKPKPKEPSEAGHRLDLERMYKDDAKIGSDGLRGFFTKEELRITIVALFDSAQKLSSVELVAYKEKVEEYAKLAQKLDKIYAETFGSGA